MDVEQKIKRARVKLLINQPFFGTLALSLPIRVTETTPTASTDGRYLFINPKFVEKLSEKQLIFLVGHEVLHCALLHITRCGHRFIPLWNIAADYVVNLILSDAHVGEILEGALYNTKYRDMSTEQVYAQLEKELPKRKGKGRKGKGGKGDFGVGGGFGEGSLDDHGQVIDDHSMWGKNDGKFNEEEKKKLEDYWKNALAQATVTAKQFGKFPVGMERFVRDILYPKLPWGTILQRYISQKIITNYRWVPSNRRFLWRNMVLPSTNKANLEVVIAIDTSGSISDKELSEFLAETIRIVSQYHTEAWIFTCDAKVQTEQYFSPGEAITIEDIKIKGGGGTDFRPVFERVEELGIRPSVLVYLTDSYGMYPESEPEYDTIWVVNNEEGKSNVPWGEVIVLE